MQVDLTEIASTLGCKRLADGSWAKSPYIRFSDREAPDFILGLLKLRHHEIGGNSVEGMARADVEHIKESAFYVELTLDHALSECNDEAIKLIKKAHNALLLAQVSMNAAVKMMG